MIKEAILKVVNGNDLNAKEAYGAMDEIMSGESSEVQMSAYLTALSMKGETIEEITASTKAMRAHCVKLLNDEEVLEIVGTGGDGSNTFNISTTSSIVISAAGVPVAKHGNRSASSKCGAADVLEALGVNIYIEPEKSLKILKEINLCFLFAQNYHLAMKFVAGVRKELSIRTIFNILGPLTNPAGATMQVLGVYDESLVKPLCEVLKNVGVKSALSVYGQDGLDEISVSDKTSVCELRDGRLKCYEIAPEDFGMERCSKEDLVGGNPRENAEITLSILNGQKGPKRNAVVLNSAAALYVAGKADSIEDGVRLASEIIDSAGLKNSLKNSSNIQTVDFMLDKIVEKTKERVSENKKVNSLDRLKYKILNIDVKFNYPFKKALSSDDIAIIAEVKKASPSKGLIAENFDYVNIAKEYEAAGASAISVLTEPYFFQGSDDYLKKIAKNVKIPVLRKDFVVDEYMIYEAKLLGASAVLLIAAILSDEQLEQYLTITRVLGMSAIVEAHDENEIKRAIDAGADIVGVNNRNLKDFSVDIENSIRLRRCVDEDIIFISESGIKTKEDIARLKENNVDAVLIGETLMKSPDKKVMIRELKNG